MYKFRNALVALAACCTLLAAGALPGAGAAHAQAAGRTAQSAVATADPSSQQIYEAARAGHLAVAQQMIEQVLRDHPGSAKAHYVAAQVYARAGQLSRARAQLRSARAIDPGLPFVRATSLAQLQQQLSSARSGSVMPGPAHRSVSWGAVALILAGVGLLIALARRRAIARAMAARAYGGYPGQAGQSGQPGIYPGAPQYSQYPWQYPPGQYPPRSGLMGNLATGLAVGAGVAAGEELVQHMLGGGAQRGGLVPPASAGELDNTANADMGGADFGLNGDNGSWDDGGAGGGDGGGADFGDAGGGDVGGGDWS